MYEGDLQVEEDGEKHSLDEITGISPTDGMWIYELCRKVKPQANLEIGLAYRFSTIYFLAVLAENGNGHHSSIEPISAVPSREMGGNRIKTWRSLRGKTFQSIEECFFAALTHLADHAERLTLFSWTDVFCSISR